MLERESHTHVVDLRRDLVERMERRANFRCRRCKDPEQRRAIGGLATHLRMALGMRRETVELKGSANWFSWMAEVACDGPDGLLIGLALAMID